MTTRLAFTTIDRPKDFDQFDQFLCNVYPEYGQPIQAIDASLAAVPFDHAVLGQSVNITLLLIRCPSSCPIQLTGCHRVRALTYGGILLTVSQCGPCLKANATPTRFRKLTSLGVLVPAGRCGLGYRQRDG